MSKTVYITSSGEMKREHNTISFSGKDLKKTIPVESTSNIMVFGEITFNKRLLEFLSANNISIQFFSWSGRYVGSFFPDKENGGNAVLCQASSVIDRTIRLQYAKSIISSAIEEMKLSLQNNLNAIESILPSMDAYADKVHNASGIDEIMGFEGNVRKLYYKQFDAITKKQAFTFTARTKRPPMNPINTLISFLNTLCYSTVYAKIRETGLDPRIGFLHTTEDKRSSLNLDIAELFKPRLVDNLIFRLIRGETISPAHFRKSDNDGVYLNPEGRNIVLREWDKQLSQSWNISSGRNYVTSENMIREEVFCLRRSICENCSYDPTERLSCISY